MNHETLRVLALYTVYFIAILIPVLAFLYSDHFRRNPSPSQYASLFGLTLAIGILLFLPAISVVAGTALAGVGIAWLSARFALSGVSYQRSLEPARLFPGDEAKLNIRLDNRKTLPLAWVTLTDPIGFAPLRTSNDLGELLRFSADITMLDTLSHALVIHTAVGPYQAVLRTYGVTGIRRGVYRLGPAEVVTGDPFGIFTRRAEIGQSQEIIVYPRVYRPDDIGLPFREAMGELVTRTMLYEDPTLLAGSREFRPGDPLRHMHWKALARTGKLQVRLNDPSTTAQVMLVLNLNTFQHVWQGVDLERVEAVVEAGASIGTWALEKGFATGLRSNGIVPGLENAPRLPASANPRQSVAMLEHLARLSFSGRFTAEEVLLDEARRLRAGVTVVFVTSVITPELVEVLKGRALSGRVCVAYCGRFAAPAVRGLPIYFVGPRREVERAVS